MKLRWVGPLVVKRMIDAYEWSRETGFVQDVTDAGLAAELLTSPREPFVVDADDALVVLSGVGPQRVAEMALAGIVTLVDLAALDETGIKRLDRAIWASAKQIRAWVKQARELLGQSVEEQEAIT